MERGLDCFPLWIKEIQPVMYREFTLDAPVSEVACARLCITGLGVYEAGLNGEKAGEEYLAPFTTITVSGYSTRPMM